HGTRLKPETARDTGSRLLRIHPLDGGIKSVVPSNLQTSFSGAADLICTILMQMKNVQRKGKQADESRPEKHMSPEGSRTVVSGEGITTSGVEKWRSETAAAS
ncbi:hypothetical protein BaRGS_00022675, partial [Batillaria attramentaria]